MQTTSESQNVMVKSQIQSKNGPPTIVGIVNTTYCMASKILSAPSSWLPTHHHMGKVSQIFWGSRNALVRGVMFRLALKVLRRT